MGRKVMEEWIQEESRHMRAHVGSFKRCVFSCCCSEPILHLGVGAVEDYYTTCQEKFTLHSHSSYIRQLSDKEELRKPWTPLEKMEKETKTVHMSAQDTMKH